MRAYHVARIEDLSAADRLQIWCDCRRVVLISVVGLGLPGMDADPRSCAPLKCENCGERGKVDVGIGVAVNKDEEAKWDSKVL